MQAACRGAARGLAPLGRGLTGGGAVVSPVLQLAQSRAAGFASGWGGSGGLFKSGGGGGARWLAFDGRRGMCAASASASVEVPKPVAPHVVSSLKEEKRRRERLATLYREYPVTSLTGEERGKAEVATAVFDHPLRTDILQRVVLWQQAKKRAPAIPVKRRDEVRGGGKKPWPQKGQGRARAGSIRSPLWRGGGKAHGRRAHTWEFSLNKKVRRLGVRVALSARMREGKLVIVDDLEIENNKTSLLKSIFDKRGWDNALIISEEFPDNFKLACSNIPHVDVLPAKGANVYSILLRRHLILTKSALEHLHRHLLRLPSDNE
jgi:large subunit ribosomal protein L4